MELQLEPGDTSPSAISRDLLRRIDTTAEASSVDPTEVRALLDEALALPIRNERDLQDIVPSLANLGWLLLTKTHTELGFSTFGAASDIVVSAIRRGVPPRCAIMLSNQMQGLGLGNGSFQLLAGARAAVTESGGEDLPLHLAHIDCTIGNQHRMVGNLDIAEEFLQLALEEFESRPDGPPALHSLILNNLGLVLFKMGALEDAGNHLRAALRIDESNDGDPRTMAITFDNLALVELDLAREADRDDLGEGLINMAVADHLRNAEEYLEHARTTFQNALPGAEADYAICLANTVDLARYRNDPESADRYSREALEILERMGDWQALWAARCTRAEVLYEQGKWSSVVDLLGPFTEPPVDPTAANALTYLAQAAARMGDTAMSLNAAAKVAEIDDQLILDRIQSISEAQALHIFGPFGTRLEILLGVGLAAKAEGETADWLYEVALNRTGLLFERFGAAWIKAYSAKGAPLDLVERVRSSRAAAARMDLDGADARSIGDARRRHDEAARQAGDAEADLLGAVGRDARKPAVITPDDVRAALDDDTLLLDFAFVQTIDDVRHYAVFIVRNAGSVELRDLGPVKEVDSLIGSLADGLGRRSAQRKISFGDAAEDLDPDAEGNSWAEPAKKLVALLFPRDLDLPASLRVSPIGLWSMVPFSLLPVGGRPLIEDHLVSYVPSGRWLGARAMSSHTQVDSVSPPIVMGDPDYDLASFSELGFSTTMRFDPLPNAAIEVREIAARLKVQAKTGKEASRDELANARSPFILHLATHGTMLDAISSIAEQSEPKATVIKSVGGVAVSEELDPSEDIFGVVIPGFSDESPQARHHARVRWLKEIGPRDPRSRSLIVLAGANAWLAGLENPPEIGTGFLTAGELALTDFTCTELVVLSACQTGSGAISVGDGTLLGLRSASLIAGAASCLTALWPVHDEATTELMLAFYAALENGVAREKALREAQLAVREKWIHPFYWAAWVLDGDNGLIHVRPWNQIIS